MRKLMWFTIGFTAACAVGAYLVSGLWLLLLALFCLICLVGTGLFLREQGRQVRAVCLGLAVAFVWMWGYDAYYLHPVKALDNQSILTTVTAQDNSTQTDRGYMTPATMEYQGRSYHLRLYTYGETPLLPGDILRGRVALRYTMAEQFSDYYSSSGIYLVGYAESDLERLGTEASPLRDLVSDLRQKILLLLDQMFPADTLGFARALLLGDDGLLTYETNTHLSISGIRHVVAVSGQHVAILFSLIYFLVGKNRVLTPLVGFPLLILFAALTGFTPSVNRACIMQGLMLLALMSNKDYDPPTALSFSVLVMLTLNPMSVASVSFQLSCACVVGMLLFYRRIHDYLMNEKRLGPAKGRSVRSKLTRWLVSNLGLSLSTTVMTLPLCAMYFGTISLVSILTNLLTLWLISFLFCGIMAVCLIALVHLPAAILIAKLLSWPIRFILLIAKTLASFPLAAVYTESPYIVLWLVFCYILLAVFFNSRKKQSAVLVFCAAMGLCAAIGLSWLEPKLEDYRVTVLDVGQGQCILIRQGDKNYMVDCGGDYPEGTADLVVRTLLSQGVTELDGIILTHYDSDHAGAVEYLLTRIPAENLYLPNIPDQGTVQSGLIRTRFSDITWIHSNASLVLEDGMLQLFVGDREKDDAESGLCILCRLPNCDILVTGDRNLKGETALLQQVTLPDIDILVAGHHGSKHATGRELLKAILPETVIISAGRYNPYGHPAWETIDRLEVFGCRILCTADHGTILIRG